MSKDFTPLSVFVFARQNPSEKESTLKGKFALMDTGAIFFPFSVDSFSEGRQNNVDSCLPWNCIFYP